jgi:hypothetical protein
VRALADANHVVYAGMRDTAGRNAESAAAASRYADEHGVTLRAVDMDVSDQDSVDRAVLPHLRQRGDGLVVRVGSSSSHGGTPPYLGPHFAA